MNWLTRMEIGAEYARSASLVDSYAWHRRIWECFPGQPDRQRDFLTRVDELERGFRVWVLSLERSFCPSWCSPDDFAVKEITPTFLSHRYYAFDLRANPVKALVQRDVDGLPLRKANGRRKSGKRVPLINLEELQAWIARKGQVRSRDQETGQDVPGGFRLVEERPLEIHPQPASHFRKKGQHGYHGGVQFRGVLEVTDRKHFSRTYQTGIGSAKGFGFGLLLLAPIDVSKITT